MRPASGSRSYTPSPPHPSSSPSPSPAPPHPHPHSHAARPPSPRRVPTGPLDPIADGSRRLEQAVANAANANRPVSASRGVSPPSPPVTLADVHNWLSSHAPGLVVSWCSTHAEPLLGGYLESWMAMNATQLTQVEINKVVTPLKDQMEGMNKSMKSMQEALEATTKRCAELELQLQKQQQHIQQLQQHHIDFDGSRPSTASLPASPQSDSSILPSVSPTSSSSPSSLTSSGRGLGLGRKSSTPSVRTSLGFGSGGASISPSSSGGLNEDGIASPVDLKQILRNRMSQTGAQRSGLGLGLGSRASLGLGIDGVPPRSQLASVLQSPASQPGPGEEFIAADHPERHHGHAHSIKAVVDGAAPSPTTSTRRTTSGLKGTAGPVDIIVVEDLGVAQKIAHAALTRGHYKVEVAGDGPTAIELYKKYAPTLKAVLMDIHLPGISGIETTERIRKLESEMRPGQPPVYIYGLTGDVSEEDLIKYKQCGMDGCILKGRLLAEAVKEAMEQSQNGVEFVNLCDKEGFNRVKSTSTTPTGSMVATSTDAATVPGLRTGASPEPHPSATALLTRLTASPPSPNRSPIPSGRRLVPDLAGSASSPAASTTAAGAGAATGTSTSTGAPVGPNVLLVEDVRVSQRMASRALEKAGYRVETADNGEGAVEKFKQHAATLKIVLMDINLPGISGTDATEEIRAYEKQSLGRSPSDQSIVFGLTGNVDTDNLKLYEESGMNGCIVKGQMLASALKQALDAMQKDPHTFVNLSQQ